MKPHFNYAGKEWLILKRASFGRSNLDYELIFGEEIKDDILSSKIESPVYICYLYSLVWHEVKVVFISSNFSESIDHYFKLLSSYA